TDSHRAAKVEHTNRPLSRKGRDHRREQRMILRYTFRNHAAVVIELRERGPRVLLHFRQPRVARKSLARDRHLLEALVDTVPDEGLLVGPTRNDVYDGTSQ